jgi:hypothetical protein
MGWGGVGVGVGNVFSVVVNFQQLLLYCLDVGGAQAGSELFIG